MSQTCRGVHRTPTLMILFAYSHNFWCDENCVFSFARNACNRVRCTRTGEHGSTLHYFGNCISFIRFIFIINFLLSSAGVQWTPLLDCESNYNTTLGHNMLLTLQTVFPTLIFHFQFSILHLTKPFARAEYVLVLRKLSSRIGNGGSPCYRFVRTIAMLRSGINVFWHYKLSTRTGNGGSPCSCDK